MRTTIQTPGKEHEGLKDGARSPSADAVVTSSSRDTRDKLLMDEMTGLRYASKLHGVGQWLRV